MGLAPAAVAGACWHGGPSRLAAIEPIRRTDKPKFKLSLAAYSYRDYLTGKKSPKLTLDDFIDDCAKLGLEGTELTSYYFPAEPSREYLLGIKERCFRLGLDVSGTAVGNDFCHPAGEKRDQEMAHVKGWIDHAAVFGAPVIRIFSGSPHGTSEDEARKLCIAGIEECCAYAGQQAIYLALENHGGLTSTADGILGLVRAVQSPWFGVNVDTGNFHSDDVYGDLAKIAPYAVNVQVKISVSGPTGGKRPSDFGQVAKLLADAGYRGYLALEHEEPDDPRETCGKYLGQLREALAKYG